MREILIIIGGKVGENMVVGIIGAGASGMAAALAAAENKPVLAESCKPQEMAAAIYPTYGQKTVATMESTRNLCCLPLKPLTRKLP